MKATLGHGDDLLSSWASGPFRSTAARSSSFLGFSAAVSVPLSSVLSEPQTRRAYASAVTALSAEYPPAVAAQRPATRTSLGAFLDVGRGVSGARKRLVEAADVTLHGLSSTVAAGGRGGRTGVRALDFLFAGHDADEREGHGMISADAMSIKMGMSPGMQKMFLDYGGLVETWAERFNKSQFGKFIDFTGQSEDRGTANGWVKIVPQGVRLLSIFDVVGVVTMALTMHGLCPYPLRRWLLGGILLGTPMTMLVDFIAKHQAPWYKMYRFRPTALGRNRALEEFKGLRDLELYDRYGQKCRPASSYFHKDTLSFVVELEESTMLTGYHAFAKGGGEDAHSWYLEGSTNGITWTVVDAVHNAAPQGGAYRKRDKEMLHLADAHHLFRIAWFSEVVANAGALMWLITGTAWVSLGAESCADGAPLLYYVCFGEVVIAWSCLGAITMLLIISAVAMLVYGEKPRAPA